MANISKMSSYQAGVLQSKAFRAFKNMKNNMLKQYDLSMMQWAVLGFIHDAGESGIRITELARELDTTQAFITNTVNVLEAKDFVIRSADPKDTRAKKVVINESKSILIENIEQNIREQLRKELYSKITRQELITYISVIEKFAESDDN